MSVLQPLTIDTAGARHWAVLRVRLAEIGRRAKINDLWIAAVALANDLPVLTQDEDFDPWKRWAAPRSFGSEIL